MYKNNDFVYQYLTKQAKDIYINEVILFKREMKEIPYIVIDINKQKTILNSYNFKIWFCLKEVFSEKEADEIFLSEDMIQVPIIKYSDWELIDIHNNGYAVLKNILDNNTIIDNIPLPYNNDLFYKLKRERLKNPNKTLVVTVMSYNEYAKIYSIKIEQ